MDDGWIDGGWMDRQMQEYVGVHKQLLSTNVRAILSETLWTMAVISRTSGRNATEGSTW